EDISALRTSDDAQVASSFLQLEGLVLQAEGRPADAALALGKAQEVLVPMHARRLDPLLWGFELDALADAGNSEELEERLRARDESAAVERTPFVEALHARFSGRLLALRGDAAGAADALESAARQFAGQRMRFFEAATLVELGEVRSVPVPPEVRETLERLRAAPWLDRADALERAVTV